MRDGRLRADPSQPKGPLDRIYSIRRIVRLGTPSYIYFQKATRSPAGARVPTGTGRLFIFSRRTRWLEGKNRLQIDAAAGISRVTVGSAGQ
jgi:hypothetical protein